LRDTDSTLKPDAPQRGFKLDIPESPPAIRRDDTRRIRVTAFKIVGNTVFPESELAAVVASYVGKELGFSDLDQAVAAVSNYYRSRGYFLARAYLPAQDIRDGVVIIQLLEGRLGNISIEVAPGLGLNPQFARESLMAGLKPGDIVSTQRLERALLSLNELAGYDVRASFSPGEQTGVTDITLRVTDTTFVSGGLFVDNFGNRFSGELRAGGNIAFNNLTGRGDRLSLRGVRSADQGVGIANYDTPIGTAGARVGATASYLDYSLCCAFAPLQIEGKAKSVGVNGSYPLLLTRATKINLQLAFDHRRFDNDSLAINVSSHRINALTLATTGEHRLIERDGLATWSAGVIGGRADLSGNATDLAADAITAQTNGGYGKFTFAGTLLWPVSQNAAIYIGTNGQVAGKNLDSSEKFVLGGPYGVRGYPIGEAPADSGVLGTAELRYLVRGNIQLAGFFDAGYVQLHKSTWTNWQGTNPNLSNNFGLASTGLTLSYVARSQLEFKAVVATPVGSNHGASVNGLNSDGRGRETRMWLQAAKYF
jgi:hemolysin activation/secretion protein